MLHYAHLVDFIGKWELSSILLRSLSSLGSLKRYSTFRSYARGTLKIMIIGFSRRSSTSLPLSVFCCLGFDLWICSCFLFMYEFLWLWALHLLNCVLLRELRRHQVGEINIAISWWKCYCNYGLAFWIRRNVGINVVIVLLMGILVPPGSFIVNFSIIGRVLLMFVILGFLETWCDFLRLV